MPTIDFISLVQSLQQHVMVGGPLWTLVQGICWLMAGVFAYVAILQLKDTAGERQHGYRAPIMTFLAAVLMSSSPTFIETVMVTSYGTSMAGTTPLSYVVDPNGNNKLFASLLTMVTFIGYCFFVRGIWVLKEAGEPQRHPQSTIGKSIAILFAGMSAIYIDVTLKMLGSTFGWDLSNVLN